MKEFVKITLVLTIVCAICAFLLAFVNSLANDKIETNDKNKIEDAIFKLAPTVKRVEKLVLGGETIHKLFDGSNNHIGYAFLARGDGYQGTIKILVVANPTLEKLEGREIIESVETPGLGAKIKEDPFKDQFKRLNVSSKIECVKEKAVKDNQITAISSATISSKSVVNILNKNLEDIKLKLKK
jgi:electron transport complex protein RnfG